MKKPLLFTVLTSLLLASPSGLSDSPQTTNQPTADGGYQAWGSGLFNCGKWTQDNDPLMRNLQVQWVMGWMSAIDYQMAAMRRLKQEYPGLAIFPFTSLAKTDADAIQGWIDKYCRDHPLDQVRNAAIELVAELQRRSRAQ